MSYSVHVGFGFHVNCYHSYRGDTCDALGFGSDIRIIRSIIDVLNRCNAQGISVRGTWDFENAYSLEEILPKYAPDIIEHVRERQQKYGDENILMGYNNGAMILLEAMASGLACICTDEGGVTDFTVNGKNAIATGYRRSDEIADALMKLRGNPFLRERLSMGALHTAKERSWDSVMGELMRSYDKALQGGMQSHAV